MIIISTQVPDFFRKVHSNIKVEPFGDFLLRIIPKEFSLGNEIFISKLIEDFKKYNDIYIRIPIKGDRMFHNGAFYSVDVTDVNNPILLELENHTDIPEIEIDLLNGYYYNGIEKISQVPQTNMILTISKALGITSLIDYLNNNNILKQYVKMIDDSETTHELEIYDKWLLHNLNIIKSV
jgi:hypothetical protein